MEPVREPLTGPWAVRIASRDVRHAAALRLLPGVLARIEDDAVWLRGGMLDAGLDARLRAIPRAERFHVDDDGRMIPIGRRVPVGRLPADGWSPAVEQLTVEPPATALPGIVDAAARVPLALLPCGEPREPSVLVANLGDFAAWAVAAPEVRLRRLAFAADDRGRVAVRGTPLPPIRGQRLVERDRVALPCGLRFAPDLPHAVIGRLVAQRSAELIAFAPDGSFERIPGEAFVAATRSAVRATIARHDRG